MLSTKITRFAAGWLRVRFDGPTVRFRNAVLSLRLRSTRKSGDVLPKTPARFRNTDTPAPGGGGAAGTAFESGEELILRPAVTTAAAGTGLLIRSAEMRRK